MTLQLIFGLSNAPYLPPTYTYSYLQKRAAKWSTRFHKELAKRAETEDLMMGILLDKINIDPKSWKLS